MGGACALCRGQTEIAGDCASACLRGEAAARRDEAARARRDADAVEERLELLFLVSPRLALQLHPRPQHLDLLPVLDLVVEHEEVVVAGRVVHVGVAHALFQVELRARVPRRRRRA